jgi:hypothetical protein
LRAVPRHGGFGFAKAFHVERGLSESALALPAPVTQELGLYYVGEQAPGSHGADLSFIPDVHIALSTFHDLFQSAGQGRPHHRSSRDMGRAIAEAFAEHRGKVISSRKGPACEEVANRINARFGAGRAIAVPVFLASPASSFITG